MVIEKFPYIFKKFVKSSVALVKRNQISTWAMWKSDFWSLVQLVISRIFWKCMEIYQWPSLILTHTWISISSLTHVIIRPTKTPKSADKKNGSILVINCSKNWSFQKMSITSYVLVNWYSSMKKKLERFG